MLNNIKKFLRYISIYGFFKSFVKAIGRKRIHFPFWVFGFFNLSAKKKLSVGLIGCGQFCFSTIAYYLTFSSHGKVEWCMDKNIDSAKSLAKSLGIKQYSDSNTFKEKKSDIIYISTYHSTHADYAIKHLENGSDVYVEKPLCTNWDQFNKIQNCFIKIKKVTNLKIIKYYVDFMLIFIIIFYFLNSKLIIIFNDFSR